MSKLYSSIGPHALQLPDTNGSRDDPSVLERIDGSRDGTGRSIFNQERPTMAPKSSSWSTTELLEIANLFMAMRMEKIEIRPKISTTANSEPV